MIHLLLMLAVLFLPIFRGGYVVTVTGQARWGPRELNAGPVVGRRFALLKMVSKDPLIFRHSSESPETRTDTEGRFAFQGVKDGMYVLAIEWRAPFGWRLVWPPGENVMVLVIVEGKSVEMGVVRVAVTHLWGE